MEIKSINIQNFRKLLNCHIELSRENTIFVGANNSGKTSAIDALKKFLDERKLLFNDITLSHRTKINNIGNKWVQEETSIPEDFMEWESIVPKMDIWLKVTPQEIHHVINIIPTLKWRGNYVGVRLAFFPNEIDKLFIDYRNSYYAARNSEKTNPNSTSDIILFPKDLCDYIENKFSSHFSIKAFILDPDCMEKQPPPATSNLIECSTNNPLKGLIKVDIIDAQRGFSDPDSSHESSKKGKLLSSQLSNYYDKHLDPEKNPSTEDLEILEATEKARATFNENLGKKFNAAIKELESLGYPGISDPNLTISVGENTSESLKHNSDVQYSLSKNDPMLKLPEKYNGLGYQNLISMVFSLMRYRDDWMRVGKAKQNQDYESMTIEPIHLVLVEEPEAHLHVQVQQVFIRKAYEVLTNHEFIKKNPNYSTQLVISTHSSHIARETDFSNLRYFKRLLAGEGDEGCNIATSRVINLSEVFGNKDETSKFVTRYLQTTHCDLFFADALILVEGAAEGMLVPHFIRNKFDNLYQRYVSILRINGRHAYRLKNLIGKLCLPTLIITDLDAGQKTGHHNASQPKRGEDLISTNYTITKWLLKENNLDTLLDSQNKEFSYKSPYNYSIHIAYQTPITILLKEEKKEALAGTFEDSLIYSNFSLFEKLEDNAIDSSLIRKVKEIINSGSSFEMINEQIYETLRKGPSGQKAEFALDVIFAIDPSEITVPEYINEGLFWLQNAIGMEDEDDE